MACTQTRRSFVALAGVAASVAAGKSLPPLGAAEARERSPRESAKRPFALGVASYTFRKFKLDETLAMTRRVGLEYICFKSFHLPLESKPDEIARVVAKVKAAGLKLYGGGVITMGNKAQVEQAFDYAKAAGMRVIIASPAPDVLPLVNEKVRQSGIQVAIHNHGPGDKTYPTPQSVYEKVKGLDKGIGLCIDVGHTVRIGADPIRSARDYADRLLDVHIKDVMAAAPDGKESEVGRGVIDIPQFLRTLIQINYSGVVAFEYEKDEGDPLAGLAESVGYVKGVLAAI